MVVTSSLVPCPPTSRFKPTASGHCVWGSMVATRSAKEKPVTDADVIIVGAGPTGLMLAVELGLAGVRALVLERLRQPSEIKKAGGLSGQILELLRYRGLL